MVCLSYLGIFPSSQGQAGAGKTPAVVRTLRSSSWVWKNEMALSSPLLLGIVFRTLSSQAHISAKAQPYLSPNQRQAKGQS
jgi:hypothetical protein